MLIHLMKRFAFWRRTLLHFLACAAVAFGMLFMAEDGQLMRDAPLSFILLVLALCLIVSVINAYTTMATVQYRHALSERSAEPSAPLDA